MKENIIKVAFCVAYDWELLKYSVPPIYDFADSICMSIDKNRKSWSGSSYKINNEAFYTWLQQIDVAQKIKVYEDDFSIPKLTSIQNDSRQRNLMAEYMGKNGWHIQIDADEYFLNFEGFVNYLKKINSAPKHADAPLNVSCNLIPIFKKLENGYLYVDFKGYNFETVAFATNRPSYENARKNGYFNLLSNSFVVHQTWARNEKELWQKLNSWGHDSDIKNKQSYFNLWKILDNYNYHYVKNIHPLYPDTWPALGYCEGRNMQELIQNLVQCKDFFIPNYKRALKNSKNISRIKAIINKL